MAAIPVGQESESIKKRLNALFAKLDEAYPNKVILSLAKDHKKWAETVTELYRLLGYESGSAFLEAYGYTVEKGTNKGGRPTNDHAAIIEELKRRYPNGPEYKKLDDLEKANPDLAPKFKTLTNNANDLFGMTLAKYLKSIGVLEERGDAGKSSEAKEKREMAPSGDARDQLEEKLKELQKRYLGKPLPTSVSQLKFENQDLQISGIDSKIRELLGEQPVKYLQRCGLIKSKEGLLSEPVRLRDTPRYKPTEKMIREYYCSDGPNAATRVSYYTAFENMLKEIGTPMATRKAVITKARAGINTHTGIYAVSNDGKRITFATQLLMSSGAKRAKDDYYEKLKVGSFDLVRDTKNRAASCIMYTYPELMGTWQAFKGIVVMNEKDKILGEFPWNSSVPISPLWDLGKLRIENVALERCDRQNVTVSFDMVLVEYTPGIASKYKEQKEQQNAEKDKMFRDSQTKPFVPLSADPALEKQFAEMTCYVSAVFRGIDKEAFAALEDLYDGQEPSSRALKVGTGVSQFVCDSIQLPRIMREYPPLKAVFFAEDWNTGAVFLGYSESGYASVTSLRPIGSFDLDNLNRWTILHDPAEDSFSFDGGRYTFVEKPLWESFDYVLPDGKTRIFNDTPIPSKPYPKKTGSAPCCRIEIRYPEHEERTSPAPKAEPPKQGMACAAAGSLSGKTFVVTGDLFNYSSRDALKECIEQAGGKLAGSVSNKTTALITNFPASGTIKIRRAKECGVPIISEQEFIQKYMTAEQ